MDKKEIFAVLQNEIHSVVAATTDEQGLPQTCVIDIMLADATGVYFLTARGKRFYERLMKRPFAAISGFKGTDTLSSTAVSVRGAVQNIGKECLSELFEKNPYMAKIYPTEKSREALEVFRMYQGEGEYFDLSQLPPCRQSFSFGGVSAHETGYRINPHRCIGCQGCRGVCPSDCISMQIPRVIDGSRCLHCGNCYRVCPVKAVEKLG